MKKKLLALIAFIIIFSAFLSAAQMADIKAAFQKYNELLTRYGAKDKRTLDAFSYYMSLKEKLTFSTVADIKMPVSTGIVNTHIKYTLKKFFDYLNNRRYITEADISLNFPVSSYNKLEIKAGREDFWNSLINDIENAKYSININMFGMQADEWGWKFAKILAKKAKQGVKITIIADKSGARSDFLKNPKILFFKTKEQKLFEFYRKNGINVIFHSRFEIIKSKPGWQKLDFYHWDHRKYFIIDGKIGYTTGYTIEQHMRTKMFDTAIRAQGDIVRQMQANFFLNLGYVKGKFEIGDKREFMKTYFPPVRLKNSSKAKILVNIPRGVHQVTEAYLRNIRNARKKLYIINPYFTDDTIVRELKRASLRGVDVRVILPKHPENWFNTMNCEFHALELYNAGVKIYKFKGKDNLGMLHAKGMLVDDKVASVGSTNMDYMALHHNFEQNIESYDPEFIKKVEEKVYNYGFKYSDKWEPPGSFVKRVQIKLLGHFTQLFERLM